MTLTYVDPKLRGPNGGGLYLKETHGNRTEQELIATGIDSIHNPAFRKIALAVNLHDDLVAQCELFKKILEYEIAKDRRLLDDEGANLKTVTLNMLNDVLDRAKKVTS